MLSHAKIQNLSLFAKNEQKIMKAICTCIACCCILTLKTLLQKMQLVEIQCKTAFYECNKLKKKSFKNLEEKYSLPNFALEIPSKMNNEPIKKIKIVKKKFSIVAISTLVLCISSCTDNSHIEEMVEEYMEKPETECLDKHLPDGQGFLEQETPLPHFDKE